MKKTCRDCKGIFPITDFPCCGIRKLVDDVTTKQKYKSNCKFCYAMERRILYRTNQKYRNQMKEYSRLQWLMIKAKNENREN